jgi:hypothetical protein
MYYIVESTVYVSADNLNRQGLVIERIINNLCDTRQKGILVDSVGLAVIG